MNKKIVFDFYFVYNGNWIILSKKIIKCDFCFWMITVIKIIQGIGNKIEYVQDR